MRAVPAPGWLALHGTGRLVSDGWFDEEVELVAGGSSRRPAGGALARRGGAGTSARPRVHDIAGFARRAPHVAA